MDGKEGFAMCGRFTNRLTWEEIVRLYRLAIQAPPYNLPPRYNICHRSHPAQWHEDAAPQFQLALTTAFPCKDEYPAPRTDEPAHAFTLPEHKL